MTYELASAHPTARVEHDDLGEHHVEGGALECEDYDTAAALVARHGHLYWPDGDPQPVADPEPVDDEDDADGGPEAEHDDADDAPAPPLSPHDHSVADLREQVRDVDDAAALRSIRQAEAAAGDDARTTALDAIDDRLDAVTED